MIRACDDDQFIRKKRFAQQLVVARSLRGDGYIEAAIEQCFDRSARGLDDYAHFYAREAFIKRPEHRRQPVITGVTLRTDAKYAFAVQGYLANVFFGPLQLV